MKLPYGIADFKTLREQGYLYVDKTPYIQKLESINSKYLFFIRPRRFGKSLFLSALAHYYDIHEQENFERLYGDLYIGRHPTERKNSYLVLKLNFSGLDTSGQNNLERSFRSAFKGGIRQFINKYDAFFKNSDEIKNKLDSLDDMRALWELVFESAATTNMKMYLIIDEYDHFANDIIAMGENDVYRSIVRASGFVRDFYEAVKIGTESVIDRLFMTGISPIMLDDMTSGFNISENLTMNPIVNEMLGFTDEEVRSVIHQLGIDVNQEALMEDLRKNYNGYQFSTEAATKVYNPDMILYFFNQWQMTGAFPKKVIDENVKTDYGRLQRLIDNEENRSMLEEIMRNERVTANIVGKFSFDLMYDEEYFVSLIFYMGLLTIEGVEYGQTTLVIPNYVIKTVFWEYFERRLRDLAGIKLQIGDLGKAVWEMAFESKLQPFVDFMHDRVLKPLSNRDLMTFDEKHVKLLLFCYLNLTNIYRPVSEREVEGGYINIFLEKDFRMPGIKYEWLIELKAIKESERRGLEQVKQKGLEQLRRYAESRSLTGNPGIKKALLIFIGKTEIVVEPLD